MMRFNFNLIEILLAVVILSLGMTSVFVLFPAGLSNHKTAMAENSFADLAEFIISRVRAEVILSSDHEKVSYTFDSPDADVMEDSSGWSKVDDEGTLMKMTGNNSTFLVRQLSGPADDRYTDFSAIALVYKENTDNVDASGFYFGKELKVPSDYSSAATSYFDMKKAGKTSSPAASTWQDLDLGDFVTPMMLEISYPANKPYADREKVYFRFEIFNENFELKERPAP